MTDHEPRRFVDEDLSGAHFERVDLSGAVMRGVLLTDADLDAPWLSEEGSTLLVNGVDVTGFVEAQLDRRFPGRDQRRATTPEDLRAAWAAAEAAWTDALARAATLPPAALDRSVDGEWSFAQTLRHLVMATDVWLRGAVQGVERPFHPLGQAGPEFAADGHDTSVFAPGVPAYDDVLAARADRVATVRDFLASVTAGQLDEPRPHPWAPDHDVTVRACLHVVLHEEWEHLRFALRDLDALGGERVQAGILGGDHPRP